MTQPTAQQPGNESWGEALAYPLGCIGAIAGAAVGAYVAKLGFRAGIYALIAVGPLAGLGTRAAVLFLRAKGDWILALMVGAIALVAGIWTEWMCMPFQIDDSLPYFITHLHQVYAFHLLIVCIGAVVGGFIAWRG
jgi:hypothetical protein